MASRAELEDEWKEYNLWKQTQSLDFIDYLEHRDLVIARDNIDTLRELIENMDDDENITVKQLKGILRNV